MIKKLNKLQQKFLVNILSGGLKDIKYFYDYKNELDYDGLYCFNGDIEINLASGEFIEKTFFHELFHMWFHLHMDECYRKKILESLTKNGINYEGVDPEEVLAVHFAKWICKKLLGIDYNTKDYDYELEETSMPKKVIKLFEKIYKQIKSLI